MLTKILSAAFILFAVIAVLPGIFKARKRYWVECVSRLIIIISSAFLSAWLTAVISLKLGNLLLSLLLSLLKGNALNKILNKFPSAQDSVASLGEIISDIPSAQNVLIALIAFAIANIIFFILYTILKAILTAIFTKPLTKLFLLIGGAIMKKNYIAEVYGKKTKKAKKEKKKKKAEALVEETETEVSAENTEEPQEAEPEKEAQTKTETKKRKGKYGRWNFLKAAVFGALCGFVTYIIILVPIVGSIELSVHMAELTHIEDASEKISEKIPAIFADASDALVNNVGSKTVMAVGGRQLYNLYTTVSVNGEKTNFDNEITFIVDIVEGLTTIADKDTTAEEKGAAIRSTTEHIDNTVVIPSILSEFINKAGEDWIAGREFHNIPCPSLGKGSSDMVVALLKCLQGSTAETIKEDLKSIVNIIAIIAENPTDGEVDFAAILSNKTLVSKISVEVLDNDRLAPMIKHLMVLNLSAPTPTISITLPDENDPTYNEFIDKVVTGYLDNVSVGDTAQSLDNVASAVNQALAEHNVEIEDGMDTVIAAALISEYGDGKEMTSENLKSFISENITKYTVPQNNEVTE